MMSSTNNVSKMNVTNQQRPSMICAVIHVSESEIKLGYSDYRKGWDTDFPRKFSKVLWSLGLDSTQDFTVQTNLIHRNRLKSVVQCDRWYGNERSDIEWLTSGFASQSALDKSKNNHIVDDSYRQRNETMDAQYTLEQRDRYTVVQD
jgi:hypothetical protein